MSIFDFKTIIAVMSCIFTLSFLLAFFNNKKISLKKSWNQEFSFSYVFPLIYCLIFLLLVILSAKLIMPKNSLDFNVCLYWFLCICFIRGFDKSTERLIITEKGISFKTSLLGINNNSFIEWNSICAYKLCLGKYPLLKILYNSNDDEDYLTSEISFNLMPKDIDKVQQTLGSFITNNIY